MHNPKRGFIIPALFISAALVIIGVVGYAGFKYYKGLSSVEDIKKEAPESTAEWKTYRNEKYTFEMKYPSSWQIHELSPTEEVPYFSVQVYDKSTMKPETDTVLDSVTVYFGDRNCSDHNWKANAIFQYREICIKDDPHARIFASASSDATKKTVDTIIESTRFSANLADWKTYRNEKRGFEFKYPGDWEIFGESETERWWITPVITIHSPVIYNLSGHNNIAAQYRISINMELEPFAVHGNFGRLDVDENGGLYIDDTKYHRNIEVEENVLEASNEYKIQQQIISTFKFTK